MRDSSGRLADAWYAVGTSAQIAAAPVGRTVFDERLVIWRASDGSPVAFSDRCLHRNAPLSHGVRVDGCLACPYHGWTYDRNGRLTQIPAQADGAAVPDLGLRTWPATERYGLVWVWMGNGPVCTEPFPMPYHDTPGWRVYTMVTDFENGVTQLVENFMDVPHTVFVHRGWFRSPRRTPVRMTVERTAASVLVTYHQDADSIGFTGRILNPRGAPMVHTDRFYMPQTTRVDYSFGERGFVITSTCTPETPASTRVYTQIAYNLGSRVASKLLRPFLGFYTRRVITQDVEIMKLQGDNLRAHGGVEAFHHAEADLHHTWIEALRDAAARSEDPPPPETRDATFWI